MHKGGEGRACEREGLGGGVEGTPVLVKVLIAIHKHDGIESIDDSRNVT